MIADEVIPTTYSRRSLRNSNQELSSYDQPDTNDSLIPSVASFQKKMYLKKRTGNSPSSSSFKLPSRSNNTTEEFHYDTGSDSDLCDEITVGKSENRLYLSDKYGLRDENLSNVNNEITRRKINERSYSPQSRISSNIRTRSDHNGLELKNNFDVSYEDRSTREITSPDDIISQEPITKNLQLANGQHSFEHTRKLIMERCTLGREFLLPTVPILLVGLLLLFFSILGLCYLSIHTPFAPSSWFSLLNIFKPNYPKLEKNGEDVYTYNRVEVNAGREVFIFLI